jgi:serine/threonine protein kinase
MQTGGRLLGKGSYGWTFDPVPPCQDKKKPQSTSVGKVAFDIESEIKIGLELMALPLAKNYFAFATDSCKPRLPVEDPDAAELDIEETSGSHLMTLIMPNAGHTFFTWSKNKAVVADNFVRVIKHLIEGLALIHKAGYIHNDIHDSNIMIDAHNVPRFIDLGLAYRMADVTDMTSANLNTEFKPKFIWHAPEIQAWRIMYSTRIKKDEIAITAGIQQLGEYNDDYIRLQRVYPTRTSAVRSLTNYSQETEHERITKDFGTIVRKYGPKFDMWRLGLTLWRVWYDLLHWPGLPNHPIYQKMGGVSVFDKLRHLLGGMTEFDVHKRFTPAEALAHFSSHPSPT